MTHHVLEPVETTHPKAAFGQESIAEKLRDKWNDEYETEFTIQTVDEVSVSAFVNGKRVLALEGDEL